MITVRVSLQVGVGAPFPFGGKPPGAVPFEAQKGCFKSDDEEKFLFNSTFIWLNITR